ncbi:hypothetical protein BDV96DRAFT_571901 [Lophiotrema nucula]|uniref:EthD domain-containing protein n=1 Tax=Lophiotrema nucula TaxID=690887 RepID=A0A6A5ZFY1_9PLEO|nr:hypothetical protein BDV96DRAFT_571901 [Lophiotrema nucula]
MSSPPVIQVIAYLKRNPALTRDEFYEHWEKKHAPIAKPFFEKHGVTRYQQIQASGTILANRSHSDTTETVEFDGIALSQTSDPGLMMKGLASVEEGGDAYYNEVVKVDEDRFLDRQAPGEGVVAVFFGKEIAVI